MQNNCAYGLPITSFESKKKLMIWLLHDLEKLCWYTDTYAN